MTRKQIHQEIERKELSIKNTKILIINLRRKALLLSDNEQWFEEKIESHPKRKWARKENFLNGKLVGRIFWNEDFIDEDTCNIITIERQQVVRVNGEWI